MYLQIYFSGNCTSSSCARFMTNFKSPFSAHSTAIKSSFSLLSMNQFKYFTMLGWSKDYGMRLFVIDCAGRRSKTYLVELNFFQAAVTLLFVVHVEDFDQLQSHHALVLYTLGLKHIGELPLAYRCSQSALKPLDLPIILPISNPLTIMPTCSITLF